MALQCDSWSYKTSYGQRDCFLRILHRKRLRPFYVASQVLPKVCPSSCILVYLFESNTYMVRNHVPWAIIGMCHVVCIVTLLAIRWHLARENRRRDLELRDQTYDDNWVEMMSDDGTIEKVKVPKVFTPVRFVLGYYNMSHAVL